MSTSFNVILSLLATMETSEVIHLVDTVGLLLEQCDQDDSHIIIDEDSEVLYQSDTIYEHCNPLESSKHLQSCCLCKVSSWELGTAIVKIM